jgi:regulator of replication initiation timing
MNLIDIVGLIESNPVTRLSETYQSKLVCKIKERFTENEQQLFLASFYCYLQYDTKKDYVIDLDNVWKWLGFQQKVKAKVLLEKYLIKDIDYKSLLSHPGKQSNAKGGHNKEIILLTVRAFKMLCLKAGTKKAHDIHEYYARLEETLQEIMNEESNELRIQLEEKDKRIENLVITNTKEKDILRENTILEQFPNNVQCVYFGLIDDVSNEGEKLIKFGSSNSLHDRVSVHKRTYTNFRLVYACKVDNKTQIENLIKKHRILSKLRRNIIIKTVKYTELLSIRDNTIEVLIDYVKRIIEETEYNPENYAKLMKERDILVERCKIVEEECMRIKSTYRVIDEIVDESSWKKQILLVTEENERLRNENIKLVKRYKMEKIREPVKEEEVLVNSIEYNDITERQKRIAKSADGFYYIDGIKYAQCFGTREEVWDKTAYKTSGELTVNDLIKNKNGIIVSKKKFVSAKSQNNFHIHGFIKGVTDRKPLNSIDSIVP